MVEKLNDIIKDRYGKGFSVRQIASVGSETLTESSLRGDDLYIPIFVKDIFLGYGLVHEARDLSLDEQSHLSRLVKMVLEPDLYSKHLDRTLHNLEIEKTQGFAEEDEAKKKSIFLFGQNASRIQKIGIEIHELSGNFAYLPFLDVASGLKSSGDLKSLSDSTLVVDLEKGVTEDLQNLILEELKTEIGSTLLLFVSSRPASQLFQDKMICEGLFDHLKSIEFSVDRLPVEKEALKDVLEMLYFQS